MKINAKRTICLLLSLVMILGVFAGCASKDISDAVDEKVQPADSGKREEPDDAEDNDVAEEPENDVDLLAPPDLSGRTIRILGVNRGIYGVSYTDILPRWKQVEERTGCKIIWEEIPGDFDAVTQTRLLGEAEGEDAPDLVFFTNGYGNKEKYYDEGIFYDLNNAFDSCPNMKAFYLEDNKEFGDLVRYSDGGIYALPCVTWDSYEDYQSTPIMACDHALWYREDIAEELGFTEPPKTISDWYEMLTAVHEAYPDMIPFETVGAIGFSWASSECLNSAYGMHQNYESYLNYFYPDENGKIQFDYATDNALAYLTEMRKWYKEGLAYANMSWETMWADIGNGVTFASTVYEAWDRGPALLENPDARIRYVEQPSCEGYELTYSNRRQYADWPFFIVNNGDEEQCLAVAQFLDYAVFSDYGIACEQAGAQGEGWDFDENGNVVFNEEYIKAVVQDPTVMYATGANAWHVFPSVHSAEITTAYNEAVKKVTADSDLDPRIIETKKSNEAACLKNLEYSFPMFYVLYLDEDDQEVVDKYIPAITTFLSETITKYLNGDMDLANFQTEFVDVLYDQFHLQELIDIHQAAYDAQK